MDSGLARVIAEDADLPPARFLKTANNAQQGGLAPAVAADQGQACAGFGVQLHIAQRGIVAVKLPDPFSRDRAHSFLSR